MLVRKGLLFSLLRVVFYGTGCVSVQFKSAIIRGDWDLWMYKGRGKKDCPCPLLSEMKHFPRHLLPEFSVFLYGVFVFRVKKRKLNDVLSLHESSPTSAPCPKWAVSKAKCQIRLFPASATLALEDGLAERQISLQSGKKKKKKSETEVLLRHYPVNYMDMRCEAERSSSDPAAAEVCTRMYGASVCHQQVLRGTYICCRSMTEPWHVYSGWRYAQREGNWLKTRAAKSPMLQICLPFAEQ